jgi:hypothetical protein
MTKLRNLINAGALAAAVSVALPVLADTTVVATGGHHYVYYRDHGIYYAPDTATYFWRDHGKWQSGASLPQDERSYASGNGIDIELDTARPFERNDYVIAHYGPARASAAASPDASDRFIGGRTLGNDGGRSNAEAGKYRYIYYADRDVYCAPTTRTYYWQSDGRWLSGIAVPPEIEPFVRSGGVEIDLDTARPYERNEYVVAHYGHRDARDHGAHED